VINKAEFTRDYRADNCSLFLLYAVLTTASLHVPDEILFSCGLASRSDAQESFFLKAKLLHDFGTEIDNLVVLQGSIILCMVVLSHPTDRDFYYWLHNAIRLANKIGLQDMCVVFLSNAAKAQACLVDADCL
jgi:hypothetical protein